MDIRPILFHLFVVFGVVVLGSSAFAQPKLSSKRPPVVKSSQKGAYQKYEPENFTPFRKHTQFIKPVMIAEKEPEIKPQDTINKYRKVEKYFQSGNKNFIDVNPAFYTLSSKHNLPVETVETETPVQVVAPVVKYPTKVRGYRIQLFNGQERETANRLKNQFASNFPNIPRYLVFVEPSYRVRVGDFYTREEAESLLREVKRITTFSDAIIIRDIVEFKPPKTNTGEVPVENR